MISSWVIFTVFAAAMQAWRNAFQKQLSSTVDVYGVTLARFIFALPLAALYLWIMHQQQEPMIQIRFSTMYWVYIVIAALSQIFATIFMVMLFKQKNYAIGVGLAKSEAILAAIIGVTLFSDHLSLWGWIGVAIGGIAVFLMSKGQQGSGISFATLGIGLASGLCFAITSLLVREASLELLPLTALYRAAWVLFCVIAIQCVVLLSYLALFKPHTLYAMWQRVGLTLKVSLCSFCASLGWFSAMSMQSVALVKTLGQIEILFSLLISVYFFKEKLVKTDHVGLLLVVLAAIMVIWA